MTTPTKLPLNQGQQAAADGFFHFLFSDQKELIISGPGGVGKTFLMGHLIDEILPRYHETCKLMDIKAEFNEVVMTATTNKAAEVLGRATGRPVQTTHSFFNLKVMDDFSTGRSKVVKSKNWVIHANKIIFIDECSMIDRDLLAMIREGTMNCKIVYVGDDCQMAPIFEPKSPIYSYSLPFYDLTEPMRTGNAALQAINNQLRTSVRTGEFLPIKLVPGSIDLLTGPQMEQMIGSMFATDTGQDRILAYTNQRVVDYNTYIRELRNITSPYMEGETLINNSAVQLPSAMLSVEEEVRVTNLAETSTMFEIEPGVELECQSCTLISPYGVYEDVLLPLDKDHYSKLVAYYRKGKRWPLYYLLKNKFPDLRPRDASTVYKAQGSTFDIVFIDLDNISTCHNPNQAARMLYVAFSRAKTRVFLYGELAQKYGGVIH